ncbi:MAG TPA: HAD family hydrolase [Dermatophilaceae bacterium]|nr:HAD family hydrolase [Dermatophilaceae bacterium]
MTVPLGWEPIRGVIFDYHSTLAHGGDPATWLGSAWAATDRPGTPEAAFGQTGYAALLDFLDHIWEHAGRVDPDNGRDRDPVRHREVYDEVMALRPEVDAELADALYASMLDQWQAYPDAAPTLAQLRGRGIRTAILSNMGVDLHPVLARQGLAPLLDAVVLSWECGAVKPEAEAFHAALRALELAPAQVLMVGDNSLDDAGAAAIGIRTLLLPRTMGAGARGLGIVTRLV